MRYIIKQYKGGDKRVKSFFAWFPYLACGEVRWLEKVVVEQHYYDLGFTKGWWTDRFLN